MKSNPEPGVAAPCGLYSDNCRDEPADGGTPICCEEQFCPSRLGHGRCEIYRCVSAHAVPDCASCREFPCALLLRFAHDPANNERLPLIMNLQRRRRLSRDEWLKQERAFWNRSGSACDWARLRRDLSSKWDRIAEIRAQICEISREVESLSCSQEFDPQPVGPA